MANDAPKHLAREPNPHLVIRRAGQFALGIRDASRNPSARDR